MSEESSLTSLSGTLSSFSPLSLLLDSSSLSSLIRLSPLSFADFFFFFFRSSSLPLSWEEEEPLELLLEESSLFLTFSPVVFLDGISISSPSSFAF